MRDAEQARALLALMLMARQWRLMADGEGIQTPAPSPEAPEIASQRAGSDAQGAE